MYKKHTIGTLFLYSYILIAFFACRQEEKADVIYGEDNRRDYYQERNMPVVANMDKVAALVEKENLGRMNDGRYSINNTKTFQRANRLCPNERFAEQPVGAFCTAFAVNDSTMVTAGHCVYEQNFKDVYVVYGFKVVAPNTVNTIIDSNMVFKIKNVRKHKFSSSWDYCVFTVEGRIPIAMQVKYSNRNIVLSDKLYAIGYPSGLPVKSVGGAKIRALRTAFLKINLDTYGGNSGSPVFDSKTHEVKGMLVRGETDFVRDGNCNISKKCQNSGCQGEDVIYINKLIKFF